MGTTYSSVHIYSPSPAEGFRSFSDGWQTYLPDNNAPSAYDLRKLSKTTSKQNDGPVLWFCLCDSDHIELEFYVSGKLVSRYNSLYAGSNKKVYDIPALVGYTDGQKRRISKILSCEDCELATQLLEEFFGVCLIPDLGSANDDPALFRRCRSDEQYLRMIAQEKESEGQLLPLKTELVYEEKGNLFHYRFFENHYQKAPHHFYHVRCTDPRGYISNDQLSPVRFQNGQLIPISQEEFDAAEKVTLQSHFENDRYIYHVNKVSFTENAPDPFKRKTLIVPRGMFFSHIDEKGRAVLTSEKGRILFMDGSMKVIGKLKVNDVPRSIRDGYILTSEHRDMVENHSDPRDTIRIYRICGDD